MYEFILELIKTQIQEGKNTSEIISEILELIKSYYKADACIFIRGKRQGEIIICGTCSNEDAAREIENIENINEPIIINPKNFVMKDKVEWKCIIETLKNMHIELEKERKQIEKEERAKTDKLTELYNCDALIETIEKYPTTENMIVAFIDANELKKLNDKKGHEAGDIMLKTFASILKKHFRKTSVYRKGGDEFIVIVQNMNYETFEERIKFVNEELEANNYSASFGIEEGDINTSLKKLILKADNKMYEAKNLYRKEKKKKGKQKTKRKDKKRKK